MESLEWLSFKGEKGKEKNGVSPFEIRYLGSLEPEPSAPKEHVLRHCARYEGLLMERLIFVLISCLGFLAIWHSWRNDFNSQMTSNCQTRIRNCLSTENLQIFLYHIFSFHFALNPCCLGQQSPPA